MPNAEGIKAAFNKRLTGYRISLIVLVAFLLVLVGADLVVNTATLAKLPTTQQTSPAKPIETAETNKVEKTASFLESVGFNSPRYLGITDGGEGKYPTFETTTVNGKSIKLWIRTHPDGALGIQPDFMFEEVSSADDLARRASIAVYEWTHPTPAMKASANTMSIAKSDYEHLKGYNPDQSYWDTTPNEARGWPAK